MNDSLSFLADVDRLCGQFATALHNTQWQIYATLTLLIILSALLFPPRTIPIRSELRRNRRGRHGVYTSKLQRGALRC